MVDKSEFVTTLPNQIEETMIYPKAAIQLTCP